MVHLTRVDHEEMRARKSRGICRFALECECELYDAFEPARTCLNGGGSICERWRELVHAQPEKEKT
jgi:hypothetical protein